MSYAIKIDSNRRIEHATFAEYVTPANADKYILVDVLPTGEVAQEQDITNYLYINNQFIYDPKPKEAEPEPEPTVWDELDAAYQEGVDSV